MSGWGMGRVAAVAVGALTTWVLAPWVSMAAHGTVDGRTVASWPREHAEHRGQGPVEGGMPRAWSTIPGPRDTAAAMGSPTSP